MNLQIDPQEDPLTTHPIPLDWVISIELYLNWWFIYIHHPDCQFGIGLFFFLTWTWSEHPELLLMLAMIRTQYHLQHSQKIVSLPIILIVQSWYRACSITLCCALQLNQLPPVRTRWMLQLNNTLSHSLRCKGTNWLILFQCTVHLSFTASMYSSNPACWLSRSLHACLIMTCMFPCSWILSIYRSSLDHAFQAYVPLCSILDSNFAQSLAQSESPNMQNLDLQSIVKLARLQLRCVSLCSLRHHLQVHLELLFCTTRSQSILTMCWWVAT